MIKKNVASQFLYFVLIKTADGTVLTGASPAGLKSGDGAAQGAVTGTFTDQGSGQYEFAMSQADTNYDEVGFLFTAATAIAVNITITTETKKMADLNDIAAGALMGLAADAITASKFDESTAFPVASADTGASQIARVGADGDTLETLSDQIDVLPTDANVTTQCALALSNIHLDHLLGVTYDPAAKPGVADALLNELIGNDAGVSQFTANALELGPASAGDATEAKQDEILVDLVDIKGTAFVKDTNSLVDLHLSGAAVSLSADAITASVYDESTAFPIKSVDAAATQIARTGADADTLETLSDEIALVPDAAGIQSECNDALVVLHLDHLLAVDYDPATPPGVATALFNELIESNAGVSRYTTGALAQAPSGTGGDATAANQTLILEDIVDMKGTAFAKDTHSLVDLALASSLVTTDGKIDTINTATGTTIPDLITVVDVVVDLVMDILEGDTEIDTAVTPWDFLVKRKGTGTELVRKEMRELDLTNITAVTQVVSKLTEP